MNEPLHIKTHVLPGNRIEVSAPELPEGLAVEITIVAQDLDQKPKYDFLELLKSLPTGPRSAESWKEIDDLIQHERNSWDR